MIFSHEREWQSYWEPVLNPLSYDYFHTGFYQSHASLISAWMYFVKTHHPDWHGTHHLNNLTTYLLEGMKNPAMELFINTDADLSEFWTWAQTTGAFLHAKAYYNHERNDWDYISWYLWTHRSALNHHPELFGYYQTIEMLMAGLPSEQKTFYKQRDVVFEEEVNSQEGHLYLD